MKIKRLKEFISQFDDEDEIFITYSKKGENGKPVGNSYCKRLNKIFYNIERE